MTFLSLFLRIIASLHLWLSAPGNKCFNYAFTMKLWLTDSYLYAATQKHKDVGSSVPYLSCHWHAAKTQMRKERAFFNLFVASISLHPNPRVVWPGPISEKMVVILQNCVKHDFVTALSTAACASRVTCMRTRGSFLGFPPLSHFQMTHEIKCEQVSGWRDPQ